MEVSCFLGLENGTYMGTWFGSRRCLIATLEVFNGENCVYRWNGSICILLSKYLFTGEYQIMNICITKLGRGFVNSWLIWPYSVYMTK